MKFILYLFAILSILHANHYIELSGTFETIDPETPTSGSFIIVDDDGQKSLHLENDFLVAEGPDLYLILSPKVLEELNNKNAMEGAVIIAKLEKFEGASSYLISSTIELEKYRSLIIHCVEYSHLYGGAPLESQEIAVVPFSIRRGGGVTVGLISGIFDVRGRRLPSTLNAQGVVIQTQKYRSVRKMTR